MIIPTFDFHVLGWPETHELGQWETPSKQMDVNGWWCGQRKGCGPRLGSTTQRLRAASKSGTGGANWLERTQNRKPRLASSTSPSTQRSQTMTASQRWELPSQYTHLHHTKTEPSEFLPRVPSPKNPRTQRKKKDRGRSDFHRFPPRRSARRQDLWKRGTDHRHSLYSPRNESRTATFAGRARVWLLTVGSRGYRSSTRVGYVASLGSKEEDNYFRSDSMKYCRHEEKKKKRKPKSWRAARGFIHLHVACAAGWSCPGPPPHGCAPTTWRRRSATKICQPHQGPNSGIKWPGRNWLAETNSITTRDGTNPAPFEAFQTPSDCKHLPLVTTASRHTCNRLPGSKHMPSQQAEARLWWVSRAAPPGTLAMAS